MCTLYESQNLDQTSSLKYKIEHSSQASFHKYCGGVVVAEEEVGLAFHHHPQVYIERELTKSQKVCVCVVVVVVVVGGGGGGEKERERTIDFS